MHKLKTFGNFINEQHETSVSSSIRSLSLSDVFDAYASEFFIIEEAEDGMIIWCNLDSSVRDLVNDGINIILNPSETEIDKLTNDSNIEFAIYDYNGDRTFDRRN